MVKLKAIKFKEKLLYNLLFYIHYWFLGLVSANANLLRLQILVYQSGDNSRSIWYDYILVIVGYKKLLIIF